MKLDLDPDGAVVWHKPLGPIGAFDFRATEIRKERSSVHALIEIIFNRTIIAWTNGNTDKDEERTRLVNSAYTRLGDVVKAAYSKAYCKHDFDLFCKQIWDTSLNLLAPEQSEGAEPVPLTMTLAPYVIKGGGTIIFAPPGRGKSLTALLMAVSIDRGIWHLWRTQEAKVLYINLERSAASMKARLGRVNECLGLDYRRPLSMIHARGRSLLDVYSSAERYIKEHGIEVAILDSISRAGMGDLTENQPVNRIMDAMNRLIPTWIALGHSPRGDDSHVYGGIHFDACADVMVPLYTQEGQDCLGVGLETVKQNDIPKSPLQIFAYHFNEYGLCGVEAAEKGQFPEVEGRQKKSLEQQVEEYLLDVGKASASQIADAIGLNRSNVSRALNGNKKFLNLGRDGHSVVYGVQYG